MLRIAIGILTLLFTLSEGRFFGSHADNMLESQNAVDIAPVRDFSQHEYKGYIYHEGDEAHDNSTNAISGAQMIIRKKIAASLRTHFGKLQSVLTAFADDDGFVREGIVFCGAGRDESGVLLTEPDMPTEFHEEGARLIEYDGWGVVDAGKQAEVDQYDSVQCGKNNCNEGSAVASIANEIRASGYQIHHKDICEAKAVSVELSARSANMKPYGETKAIVCEKPFWYERLQDCIGVATDDGGDGDIDCGAKCEIAPATDGEYEDKMCWVNYTAINGGEPTAAGVGCYEAGDASDVPGNPKYSPEADAINAKESENIAAEPKINGIRRAMRYSLSGEVSVQTTDYAYFTGCKADKCLSLRQMFAALNGNAQISAFRDLGMEEASAYWSDQIKSIKTYLQSLADTFTDFRPHSIDIFPFIENEEIVGCPMGEIEHATGETGSDTQPLCYELAMTKTKLNEQSRDGQFISRGECVCRNGLLSDDITNITGTDTTELDITSAVEADYIYLYYDMPSTIDCATLPTSVQTYCNSADWHGGDWEETLLALIPNATTTRTKIFPKHSINGIATTHAAREAEISTRRQAIQDALTKTLPTILDTSCGRIINADSGVRSGASPLLVSNKGGNCFPFPKMHEIFFRLEFETSEQGTGSYNGANVLTGLPAGDKLDERFCAEKVADIELSFRQLAYRFKNSDPANKGQQLKNDDKFSGESDSTDLDYLVYTNEKTTDSSGNEVARPFCVVNWLQEFGVRKLEDSSGKLYDDPFELQRSEVDEAVFNTELAQSTKSKVITDNILIWKAIRKELTTASDGNILDDIAQRAAQHYLYVVSTDEDLIAPFVTYRDAERVAEEVANFTVQARELNIEVKADKAAVASSIESALTATDETAAAQIAEDLVQGLLDYLEGMTNANIIQFPACMSTCDTSTSLPQTSAGTIDCPQLWTDFFTSGECGGTCTDTDKQFIADNMPHLGCDKDGNNVASSRRRLHSSRRLASGSGDLISILSDPNMVNGVATCDQHFGYSFPGNCEQLTYYKYTGKGCFDSSGKEVPRYNTDGTPNMAHYSQSQSECTGTFHDDSTNSNYSSFGLWAWPIDNGFDPYSNYWTSGNDLGETNPSKFVWKSSAGTQPTIDENSTAADLRKFRDPANYEKQVNSTGTYDSMGVRSFPTCEFQDDHGNFNGNLDGVSRYGAPGGTKSCYLGTGVYQQGCFFVPVTVSASAKGACVNCAKKPYNTLNGGYHYTGGNSGQTPSAAKCTQSTQSNPCDQASSVAGYSGSIAGKGSCPDTSDCTKCFTASKLGSETLHAVWATAITELKDIKDAVTENTKQCQKVDLGGAASCDQNNEGYFWQTTKADRAGAVNIVYPTRVNRTEYFKTEILARAEAAFDSLTGSISNDLTVIAAYANNKKHAHHEDEAQTKSDIEAKIDSLHAEGKTLQDNLKDSFKFLKEYKTNYQRNEDFWKDTSEVAWPSMQTYYTQTDLSEALVYADAAKRAAPVTQQDFQLSNFPTQNDLKTACQNTIATAFYLVENSNSSDPKYGYGYSHLATEYATAGTNAAGAYTSAAVKAGYVNEYKYLGDLIDLCSDTTLATKYGTDQTHNDNKESDCILAFPFGNSEPCYEQRQHKIARDAANTAYLAIADATASTLTVHIKSYQDGVTLSVAAQTTAYDVEVVETLTEITTEFATLAGIAATNEGGLTISELPDHADKTWANMSKQERFTYKLTDAAKTIRTLCIADKLAAAAVIHDSRTQLPYPRNGTSTVCAVGQSCTTSDVTNHLLDLDQNVLIGIRSDPTYSKLNAFKKTLADLKAINVDPDCYVKNQAAIEFTLNSLSAGAAGLKNIKIIAHNDTSNVYGNAYYEVDCWHGYTATTDLECVRDACATNWYAVTAAHDAKLHPKVKTGANGPNPTNLYRQDGNSQPSKPAAKDGGDAYCEGCPIGMEGEYVVGSERTCKNCVATEYNNNIGTNCESPDSGHEVESNSPFAERGPTSQEPCSAGEFFNSQANTCQACASGTFAPSTGSASCMPIQMGHKCGTTANGGCTTDAACADGEYSPAGTATCTPCEPGKYSSGTVESCSSCENGKYAADASGNPVDLASGLGGTQCKDVDTGYMLGKSNVAERIYTNVEKCDGAYEYSDEPGLASCKTCGAGYVVTKSNAADDFHTGCTACDGSQNIYCSGAKNITCGAGNADSPYGQWNHDKNAATICEFKSCQCGAGDALNLGVSNHVQDAEGNWQAFAVTGSGIAASGDFCPSGDSSSADSIYCTECDSTSGLYILKDASGNVKTWNDSTGFVHNITVCHVCQEPYHSNSTGNHQSECSVKTCPIGEGYPTSLSADFSDLPDQFGQSDVLSCAQCPVGRFSDTSGVGGCFRMGSGYECKTRLGTEATTTSALKAKLGCSERIECAGGSYKFDEDMAGVSKLSQTCNEINAGFYCNAFAPLDVADAGALLLSLDTVHVDPHVGGYCEEAASSRRRLDGAGPPPPQQSGNNTGGNNTTGGNNNTTTSTSDSTETASHPCDRINDKSRCQRGAYHPTEFTKYTCTWTDMSSTYHPASQTLGNKVACANQMACPVGYYSNKGDGYCTKIQDGYRCKKARTSDMMCVSPDLVIGAGTQMEMACGVQLADGSFDWEYWIHGGTNGNKDLSGLDSQAIELGCAAIEKCPEGTWSNTGDYNCLEIPAGQKCSANADGTAINATSVGCKEVVDCGSLEYSTEKTNLCQTFSGCPVGERVVIAGVSGGVTWDTAGKRTDLAGSNNTCEACVAEIGSNSYNGFNADVDIGNETTVCATWSGCGDGEALTGITGTVGDGSNDNGGCTDCDAGGARAFAADAADGLTQTTCTPGPVCDQNGEKPIQCTDTTCPCGACDAGQSGLVQNGVGVCTDCVSGRFSAAAGNGECDLCEAGKYTAATKQTGCITYGKGEGCTARATGSGTKNGCKLIQDCPKGTYSSASDSECKNIPAGYQCSLLSSGSTSIDADSEKCASIAKCTTGSYSAANTNVCVSIPAGKKCSANADNAAINGTSKGCTAITVCHPAKYSLVNLNECVAFSACSAGDYVKTAPGGDSTNGYTTARECEKCNALGAFYRSDTPAIGQLTADSTATTCYACTVCGQNGAPPVETQACSATQDAQCRAVNANADGDCTGDCANGANVCSSVDAAMTCGSCHSGYSGLTCAPITCTCANGSPVTTSETGLTNDADTCINSGDENCASCETGHNLVDGASPNGKICSAVECSCANGTPKSFVQGCIDIDDTSGDDDCQNCTAGYGFATVNGRSTCTQCAAHEYADAGTNACAAKSFQCANGNKYAPATSSSAHPGVANGVENCETCKTGYKMDGITCVQCGDGKHTAAGNTDTSCTQNTCTCNNGVKATGTDCTTNATEICVSCDPGPTTGGGYELNTAKKCDVCDNGEISDGTAAGNGCQDKQCTCTNGAGQGATGTDCTTNGADICNANPTCDSGYVKSEDSTTNPSTWTCVKQCTCTNGAGATGTACYAANTQDCATCDADYGRYLKEGAASSDEIHVCEKCSDFGPAFTDAVNAGAASTTFCALNSCPKGQGYNMPNDLNSTKFDLYLAEFQVNTFRGATLISTGEFKCRDCPDDEYSDKPETGQCEKIPDGKECRDDVTTGCQAVCTIITGAKNYNNDCTIKTCTDTGKEPDNAGTQCIAICATGTQRHATANTCHKNCPALTTGGNGINAYEANTQQNCRTATQVQGATCDVTCTATNRTATDAVLSCAQGADATTDGTWSAGPTCLLVNGQPCSANSDCESDHCHNNECEA